MNQIVETNCIILTVLKEPLHLYKSKFWKKYQCPPSFLCPPKTYLTPVRKCVGFCKLSARNIFNFLNYFLFNFSDRTAQNCLWNNSLFPNFPGVAPSTPFGAEKVYSSPLLELVESCRSLSVGCLSVGTLSTPFNRVPFLPIPYQKILIPHMTWEVREQDFSMSSCREWFFLPYFLIWRVWVLETLQILELHPRWIRRNARSLPSEHPFSRHAHRACPVRSLGGKSRFC